MKIEVVVHPNSKNPRVEKDLTEMIHVYVNAPPLEGKANKAVIESLAKFLKVKKSTSFKSLKSIATFFKALQKALSSLTFNQIA